LVPHFTAELCRAYQYHLAQRHLQTNTIRVPLAALGSFSKWAVRRDKLPRNPLDLITALAANPACPTCPVGARSKPSSHNARRSASAPWWP
jgi:site-specific recombinase XerD